MPHIIRTSDRQFFKRCRQQWDFTSKIRQNWEPIQRIEALDFGTAIHAALQAYYEPKVWGDSLAMQADAGQAFLLSIAEVQKKVKVGPLDVEFQFNAMRDLGRGILDHYYLWAPSHDDFEPRLVEIEFEVPIPGYGDDVCYQGRVDLVADDGHGYWIVDHKTAAQFGGVEWLVLDDQCSSYAWALQKQLGLEIRGVIYNEIRKKVPHKPRVLTNGELSRNKQQDTTYEVYLAAIKEGGYKERGYQEILDYLKGSPKEFVRRTKIPYTQAMLRGVEKRIQLEAKEMISDPAIYPTPSRFNCQGCPFFAPCLALQEGRDYRHILDEMYQKREK